VLAHSMMFWVIGGLLACSRSGGSDSAAASTGGARGSPTPAASANTAVPTRSALSCADYFKRAEEISKRVGIPVIAEAGSWGGLPGDMQKVPANAEFCGVTYLTDGKGKPSKGSGQFSTVFFRSQLYGNELRSFWEPILTGVGCTFKEDDTSATQTKLVWRCPAAKGSVFTILTDPGSELFSVGFLAP
jgi:hypothetical protein